MSRKRYVVGFLFDSVGRVLLIRKNRPAWQADRLNGIGGKVEPGESVCSAMSREAQEEAGIDLNTKWTNVVTLQYPEAEITFFGVIDTPELRLATAMTDEPLEVHDELARGRSDLIPNLHFVIPMVWHALAHEAMTPATIAIAFGGKPIAAPSIAAEVS